MHGLDDGILVVQGNVVGAEIPVIPNAQRVKLVDGAFHRGTGDAEDRHNRFFIGAERFERIGRQNGQTGKLLADHGFAAVEDADQLKARKIVCDVGRDRPAEISGAEQNAFVRAVQTENIADFLAQLPHGLEEWLGSTGLTISGGQARRLCLARALVKPGNNFLVLDEPGEGLDAAQEERIIERIQKLRKGVIIITHKPAGARLTDHLVTL